MMLPVSAHCEHVSDGGEHGDGAAAELSIDIVTTSYQAGLAVSVLDVALGKLCEQHRRAEWLLCRYLADVAEDRRYREVGWYSDIYHYARSRLGLLPKATRERVRIGRALRALPLIESAFVSRALGYSHVRELTRVASAETEAAWLELGLRLSARELEQRVAQEAGGSERCAQPAEVHWRTPETVELRVRLPAAAWALLSRAMAGARQAAETTLSDAEALEAVAREALAALATDARPDAASVADPRRTVVLYQCRECGQSELETNAGAVALGQAAAERLACGAARLDLATEGVEPEGDSEWPERQDPEPENEPPNVQLPEQGHEPPRRHTHPRDAVELELDREARRAAGARGAGMPAAVKRAVLARDRARCRLCGRRRYVDVHHVTARSHGGPHHRSNLCVLCTSCHDAVHEKRVRLEGNAESGLEWFDADGRRLGGDERLEARLATGGAQRDEVSPTGYAAQGTAHDGATLEAGPDDAPETGPGHAPETGPDAARRAGKEGGRGGLSPEAAALLRTMAGRGGFSLDDLVGASGLAVSAVAAGIVELELAGRVRRDLFDRLSPADRSLLERDQTFGQARQLLGLSTPAVLHIRPCPTSGRAPHGA